MHTIQSTYTKQTDRVRTQAQNTDTYEARDKATKLKTKPKDSLDLLRDATHDPRMCVYSTVYCRCPWLSVSILSVSILSVAEAVSIQSSPASRHSYQPNRHGTGCFGMPSQSYWAFCSFPAYRFAQGVCIAKYRQMQNTYALISRTERTYG